MKSIYVCTNLICFYILSNVTIQTTTVRLLSTKLICGQHYNVSVSYTMQTKTPTFDVICTVSTCKPTYENFYCRFETTVWKKQHDCQVYSDGYQKYRITCELETPYRDRRQIKLKTFGVRIAIMDLYNEEKLTHLLPVTPALVCIKKGDNF